MYEMTLAVVGLQHPNADGSSRIFAAATLRQGDPVHLVPEPKNKKDRNAVAVMTGLGMQLGYLTAERCGYISARIQREVYEVAFQDWHGPVAYIRIRFGGGKMTMPPQTEAPAAQRPAAEWPEAVDPDGPEWGA